MTVGNGSLVPSLERALTLLELLAESKKGFTLSGISRRLALPKSSAHLILKTLERRGYLQKNPETGEYCFGLKLMSLSRTALEGLELRREAKPFLEALMRRTRLTVHLAVLERNQVVLIEKVAGPGLINLATWIGRRMDVNCTGVGKALIAFLPESEFEKQVRGRGLARHNQKTITAVAELKQELVRIRKLGYSFDDEEDEIGVRCVGSPVYDSSEQVVAAISVAGTTSQIPPEQVEAIARSVKRTASAISAQLGYPRMGEYESVRA